MLPALEYSTLQSRRYKEPNEAWVHAHRSTESPTFSVSATSHHVWRKRARQVHVMGAVGAMGAMGAAMDAVGAVGAAPKPCGCRDTGG